MAAWKRKEKPLTVDEAMAIALRDQEPYWFGIQPLMTGVSKPDKPVVFPINDQLKSQNWLILLADISAYTGLRALRLFNELQHRYQEHGISFLLITAESFPFVSNPPYIDWFRKEFDVDYPIAVHHFGLILPAFGMQGEVKAVFLREGAAQFEATGPKWNLQLEDHLQKYLHTQDPGLPLFPVYDPQLPEITDVKCIKINQLNQGFKASGKLALEPTRGFAEDSTATIEFEMNGKQAFIFAESISRDAEHAKIVFEINGLSIHEAYRGPDLVKDDDGNTSVRVDQLKTYFVLKAMDQLPIKVTMRVTQSDRVNVAIYGIVVGNTS